MRYPFSQCHGNQSQMLDLLAKLDVQSKVEKL